LKSSSFWLTSKKLILVAHRGGDGAGTGKENTLIAFKTAQKAGYEYGETDVVLTADGQVIAIHGTRNKIDSLFKKGRTPRSLLQKMTLAEIRNKIKIDGETVPLLEELLKAQPKMKFFIDAKTDEVVEPLAKVLKDLKAVNRVCVDTFSYPRLQRLIKCLGPLEPATCVNIGRSARIKNKNLDLLKQGKLKVDGVHLHHSLVSKQMIDLLHSKGIKVLVWTCNSPLSIMNAAKSGADGIISDRLELLDQVLAR